MLLSRSLACRQALRDFLRGVPNLPLSPVTPDAEPELYIRGHAGLMTPATSYQSQMYLNSSDVMQFDSAPLAVEPPSCNANIQSDPEVRLNAASKVEESVCDTFAGAGNVHKRGTR